MATSRERVPPPPPPRDLYRESRDAGRRLDAAYGSIVVGVLLMVGAGTGFVIGRLVSEVHWRSREVELVDKANRTHHALERCEARERADEGPGSPNMSGADR